MHLARQPVATGLEMAWVVMRGVLQGLAMWWSEHPQVPRERVVATAMNALWIGFERVSAGKLEARAGRWLEMATVVDRLQLAREIYRRLCGR